MATGLLRQDNGGFVQRRNLAEPAAIAALRFATSSGTSAVPDLSLESTR
jgi:hypothetical protein